MRVSAAAVTMSTWPLAVTGIAWPLPGSAMFTATGLLAAAAMLSDKEKWNGKTLTCTSWKGTLKEAAAALEAVSGTKTVGSLAMPKFARSCFLSDLDAMCVFFEDGYPGTQCSVEAFKAVVPDALDAEGWFRYYGRFADGTPIAKAA